MKEKKKNTVEVKQPSLAEDTLLSRYRTMFDFAAIGYLSVNYDGIILESNLFFANLLGEERQQLLNRDVRIFLNSDSLAIFENWLKDPSADNEKRSSEMTMKRRDGSVLFTEAECLHHAVAHEFLLTFIDLTYRRQSNERMLSLTQKLRDLSAHIEAGMEKEKKRISREIHDGLGSSLSALKMELSLLSRRLNPENQDPEIAKHIRSMSVLVESTVELVRKLATELRPEVLDELGLLAALKWYTRDFEERTGIQTGFTVYPKDFRLEPKLSTAVFRIFQEIMNNISRHSKAGKVTIFLRKQQHLFLMRVRDDGIGIREEEMNNKRSFGIIGMQERVKLQKGQIKIHGIRNKGTTIVLEIPIQ